MERRKKKIQKKGWIKYLNHSILTKILYLDRTIPIHKPFRLVIDGGAHISRPPFAVRRNNRGSTTGFVRWRSLRLPWNAPLFFTCEPFLKVLYLKVQFSFDIHLRDSAEENPYRFDRFRSQVRSLSLSLSFFPLCFPPRFPPCFLVIILDCITVVHRRTVWVKIIQVIFFLLDWFGAVNLWWTLGFQLYFFN